MSTTRGCYEKHGKDIFKLIVLFSVCLKSSLYQQMHIFSNLLSNSTKQSHCSMTHLSIWDGKTHINITDQFHKD